jgi:hypothetical protein
MNYLKKILGQAKEETVDTMEIAGAVYQIGQEVELPLELVKVDNSLNPREGALDQALVLRYAEILDQLPAMTAFYLDGELVLVGGFHRYAAHELAQQATGRFIIAGKGDRDEAQERADFDNLRHGQRMTRKEERAAYSRHVRRHPAHSDVWLARELGTTDKTIRSVREELEDASEITRLDRLVGSDGIWRPRSIERPPRQGPDEEARKLTIPFELGAGQVLPPTPLAETATPGSQAWQQFAATPPLAPVVEADGGQADSEPADASEDDAMPEWLAETPEEAESKKAEAEAVAELEAEMVAAPPAPAPKPVAPPPPPAPALPPPPPPVVGRALLRVSLSVYPNGNALIDAMEGEKMLLAGGIEATVAGERVGELVKQYLSKEEPVNDNTL